MRLGWPVKRARVIHLNVDTVYLSTIINEVYLPNTSEGAAGKHMKQTKKENDLLKIFNKKSIFIKEARSINIKLFWCLFISNN